MDPLTIMTGISASLQLLQNARDLFRRDKTISEAAAISRKRMADDVGSLQEQLRAHREVIDKLVEQAKADKDMLEKHNDVLIQLSGAIQEAVTSVTRVRIVAYWAIGLAGSSVLLAILLLVLRS
jgi:hypothetical protein